MSRSEYTEEIILKCKLVHFTYTHRTTLKVNVANDVSSSYRFLPFFVRLWKIDLNFICDSPEDFAQLSSKALLDLGLKCALN